MHQSNEIARSLVSHAPCLAVHDCYEAGKMTDRTYQLRKGVSQLSHDVVHGGYRFAIWCYEHPSGQGIVRHWGLVVDPNAPGACEPHVAGAVVRAVLSATGGTRPSCASVPMIADTAPLDHYRWHSDGTRVKNGALAVEQLVGKPQIEWLDGP